MSKGIDVSRYQGTVDWNKVKAAGIEFAIIRAGFGMYASQVDPQLAVNMQGKSIIRRSQDNDQVS